MRIENWRLLAALVAAHPNRKVFGRTRLQKEVKLLQYLGFPTDYSYTIHFYGPYSESLQADISLLGTSGFIKEQWDISQEGNPYYILTVPMGVDLPSIAHFQHTIDLMNLASTVILELAATYNAFREEGSDDVTALARLRRKKGAKCEGGNTDRALKLLESMGIHCA